MRLNIFRVAPDLIPSLIEKFTHVGLVETAAVVQGDWKGSFFFSEDPQLTQIPWIETFQEFLDEREYRNRTYCAALVLGRGGSRYVVSFGKAHFYIRPFCDYDFGIELAKRISDEQEITQTSGKRYQGKQRKNIRSFAKGARLNVPAGESVEFLQSAIITSEQDVFGSSGKFGTSALLSPDIRVGEIGDFLSNLERKIADEELFKLPRTVLLSDAAEVERFDEAFKKELMSPIGTSEFSTNSHDLFGVDFVFSSTGSFTLKCGHYRGVDLERLTMADVKSYITKHNIPASKVLQLKVTHHREDGPDFAQSIKEAVDFISDEDRVVLSGGRWLRFNQDYLEYLNDSIRQIEIEETEPELVEIEMPEPEFNKEMSKFGYSKADKNFSLIQTRARTPIEAWDLSRGETVYAVKFGTPQKLNYVVDQAMLVLEIFHNKAEVKAIPDFRNYCLWMGYRAKRLPASLVESGSIILKQKVDAWARRCTELGIEPRIKLSLYTKESATTRE
jgi:uncharacterized protein (TIGR04141 family)